MTLCYEILYLGKRQHTLHGFENKQEFNIILNASTTAWFK